MTRVARAVLRHRGVLRRVLPLRRRLLVRMPAFALFVRLDDWVIGARIAVRRAYEPHVAAVFRELLRPGMHVVDVGANIGYYTMLAASVVGPTGSVAAFEPAADNAALLAASVAANGFTNVTLFPCAVAASAGVVGLQLDDSNGQITPWGAAGTTPVQAVSLDRLLGPGHPVDLIKIDIEGAEGLALAGMAALLAARRPRLITEFSPDALRAVSRLEPEAYLGRLRRLGYALRVIDRARGLSPRPESDAEIMAHFAHTVSEHLDLLAEPEPS